MCVYNLYVISLLLVLCSCTPEDVKSKSTHLQQIYQLTQIGKNVVLGQLKHHVFLYKLYSGNNIYKAFCSGSIISENRVITSAHCFLTNRKKYKRVINRIRIIGGSLNSILDTNSATSSYQQWRNVSKIYSQKYYRFPAFALAIMETDQPWQFNSYVNKIPIASLNQNYDGVCSGTAVRTMTGWASSKVLFIEEMHVIPRDECEMTLQRSCRLFYCTEYDKRNYLSAAETEGGGLVCHGTGDPEEVDEQGILVGVTTLINIRLPTLHNRLGLFHDWIKAGTSIAQISKILLLVSLLLIF